MKPLILFTLIIFSLLISVGLVSAFVFGVSGTPLENFDVNTTTGMVRYRPLNMTWLTASQVLLPNLYNFSIQKAPISISIWTYRNTPSYSTSTNRIIAKLGTGFYLSYGNQTVGAASNRTVCFQANGNFTCSTSDISLGVWHHFVGIANGTYCLIYVDGVLNNTKSCGSTTSYSNDALYISSSSSGFDGNVSNFIAYNQSLSASQVLEIYNSGRLPNMSLSTWNISLWYPLREGSGIIANNILNSSLTGTITGATWQSDNINVTTLGYQVNISIVNITNAYIYWDNGTDINPIDVNGNGNFTGNKTFSYLNNQTIWIKENYLNGIAPVITITNPINKKYDTSIINIDFSATDDYLIDSLYYSIDSGTNIIYTVPTTYKFEGQGGSHTITLYANDTSGNIASSSISLSISTIHDDNLSSNILKALILILAIVVLVFVIVGIAIHISENVNEISSSQFIKYGVTLLLVLILVIALLNYIADLL